MSCKCIYDPKFWAGGCKVTYVWKIICHAWNNPVLEDGNSEHFKSNKFVTYLMKITEDDSV